MSEARSRASGSSVDSFLEGVADPGRREDAIKLRDMMERISTYPAQMWGPSMIGFGRYAYRYESGHGGEYFRIGFSPRAKELVLYLMGGFERHQALMDRLGPYRTGKSCLYVKRLSDLDQSVLEALIAEALAYMKEAYPEGA